MRKHKIITIMICYCLMAITLFGCANPASVQDNKPEEVSLKDALKDYSQIVEGDMPEDARLTIYYISPDILTCVSVTPEQLKTFDCVTVITAGAEELKPYWENMKKLNASNLHAVEEKTYVNARLYYVLEMGESLQLLDVVVNSTIHGGVFVNGVEVENHPVIYEIISPFLSEHDRDVLNIQN